MLIAIGVAAAPAAGEPGTVDLLDQANLRIDGPDDRRVGASVAGAGDVNADGLDDVIVGAPSSSSAGAYVVYGRSTPGVVNLQSLGQGGFHIGGASFSTGAGESVAGAGDVNGDGFDDVLVGAESSDNTDDDFSGSAYVVFGGPLSGSISLASLGEGGFRIDGADSFDRAGSSVAGFGDVNEDGKAEVVLGAAGTDHNEREDSGSAYVVFGRDATEPVDLGELGEGGYAIDGPVADGGLGSDVARVPDMNGDGVPEVALGGQFYTYAGRSQSGAAFVAFGLAKPERVDLADADSGVGVFGAASDDHAGVDVDGVEDMDGDGDGELIVGAADSDAAGTDSGAAYVVYGGPTADVDLALFGTNFNTRGFRIDGEAATNYAGQSVAGTGDVNSDGRPDVLVGAPQADSRGRSNNGSAYLVYGRSSTSTVDLESLGLQGFRMDGAVAGDDAGFAVAGTGDVNGDGLPDLLVGADQADANGLQSAGAAYLIGGFDSALAYDPLVARVGTAVSHPPRSIGRGPGDVTFSIAPALPPGLLLDASTGRVYGTPTAARPQTTHTVTMTNADGTTTAAFTLRVLPADRDGDGRPDGSDVCPSQRALTPSGCPFGATHGDDVLGGNANANTICGLLGSDTVRGLGGNDRLFGDRCGAVASRPGAAGAARDTLVGGAGSDVLRGGPGDDTLRGSGGSDSLSGEGGADVLEGGGGPDVLGGGKGRNTYRAGGGNDTVNARNGKRETVDCGKGANDTATVDAADTAKGCEMVERPG